MLGKSLGNVPPSPRPLVSLSPLKIKHYKCCAAKAILTIGRFVLTTQSDCSNDTRPTPQAAGTAEGKFTMTPSLGHRPV